MPLAVTLGVNDYRELEPGVEHLFLGTRGHRAKHSLIWELTAKGTVQSGVPGEGSERPELHKVLV